MKITLKESQLRKLFEIGGGVHSDGQLDLFLEPDEMDSYRDDSNKKLEIILKEVEKECCWTHDPDKDEERPGCVVHKCYPMGYFYTHKPAYRHEFVRMLSERIPEKYLSTSYPMTAFRPEDWYVDVILKKV